jgi:hypothetical protein
MVTVKLTGQALGYLFARLCRCRLSVKNTAVMEGRVGYIKKLQRPISNLQLSLNETFKCLVNKG